MLNSQFYPTSGAASTSAPFSASQTSNFPWLNGAFVAMPREFFMVMGQLSDRAIRAYLGHLSNVQPGGDAAGQSYQYRDNFADKCGRSTDTTDRGNAELAQRGMIERAGRAGRGNTSQIWRVTSPLQWRFEGRSFAARLPQNSAAKGRRVAAQNKRTQKENLLEQNTPVVVFSQNANVPAPETAPDELVSRMIEHGITPVIGLPPVKWTIS